MPEPQPATTDLRQQPPAAVTELETDRLAELIQRKRSCLAQLHQMGMKQLELVADGAMAKLLEVLAAKQRLLVNLHQIERALDPFRGQSPEERRWPSAAEREKCAEELTQCETLLGEIVTQEKQSEAELIRRRDEAAQRLQGAHVASLARGAYGVKSPAGISQLDLSSES